MNNLIGYMEEFGGDTLEKRPFGEVDNLLFSRLAYGDFSAAGCEYPGVLKSIDQKIMPGFLKLDAPLLERTARSARFGDTVAVAYMEELEPDAEKQFSAVTFLLPDKTAYIAFRGTDSTLVGWKEDFNLAFMPTIPAQLEAVEYINTVGRMLSCPLRVGGHSKGGNLAVYAAARCDRAIQDRITVVYNNDGPGHDLSMLRSDGYRRIRPRLETYLPQSSIIGMLLEHDDDYTIVCASGWGIFQHYPYNWQIDGVRFDTKPNVTRASACLNESIRQWLAAYDTEKRRLFIDTVFDVLAAGEAKTLGDLTKNLSNLPSIINATRDLEPEERQALNEIGRHFVRIAYHQYSELIQTEIHEFAASAWAKTKSFKPESLRSAAAKAAQNMDMDRLLDKIKSMRPDKPAGGEIK